MIGTKFLLRRGYVRSVRTALSGEGEQQGTETGLWTSPVIINVSSLLGLSGGYGTVAYAASKAGVLGFTRALATEYASHHVRVNALLPGYVGTNMTKGISSLLQSLPPAALI